MNTIRTRSLRHSFWATTMVLIGLVLSHADKTLAQSAWTSSPLTNAFGANWANQSKSPSDAKGQKQGGGKASFETQAAGSGTNGRIAKWTDDVGTLGNSVITEASNGNVGIGTTNPGGTLDVQQSSSGEVLSRFWNTGTGSAALRFVAADASEAKFQFTNTSTWTAGMAGSNNTGNQNNNYLSFRVRGAPDANTEAGLDAATRMTILGNGNVGIGTMTPRGLLDVVGTGDIYLASNTISGTSQSLFLPGHIYLAPLAGGNVSYFQARRSNDSGSTELQIRTTNGGVITDAVRINSAGQVGIGTTSPQAKLHVAGDALIDGNIAAKYQDVAEWVPAGTSMSAGTVVVLDAGHSNQVVASSRSYDTRVAGVVSAKPGVILGEGGAGKVMVATTGRVRVKVDATNAPIRVGDLLVTSDKEGIAMRSQPLDLGGTPIHRPGTLIGKALEPLDKGVGEILMLLSLQ